MDTELDFDRLNSIPVISLNGDTARTGRNMPVQSHKAGDRSQMTLKSVKHNILVLVRENPFITGADLNVMYQQTYERRGWVRASLDSPRKRAESLLADGYLIEQPPTDGGRRYLISEAGLAVIA